MRNRTITAVLLAGMSWLVGSPQLAIAAQDAGDAVVESLVHVQRLPGRGAAAGGRRRRRWGVTHALLQR